MGHCNLQRRAWVSQQQMCNAAHLDNLKYHRIAKLLTQYHGIGNTNTVTVTLLQAWRRWPCQGYIAATLQLQQHAQYSNKSSRMHHSMQCHDLHVLLTKASTRLNPYSI